MADKPLDEEFLRYGWYDVRRRRPDRNLYSMLRKLVLLLSMIDIEHVSDLGSCLWTKIQSNPQLCNEHRYTILALIPFGAQYLHTDKPSQCIVFYYVTQTLDICRWSVFAHFSSVYVGI